MNKGQLISHIAHETGQTKSDVEAVINAYHRAIIDNVSKGDAVRVLNFGTFEAVKRNERMGRNPQTGEAIALPAKYVPKFKPSALFKNSVNE